VIGVEGLRRRGRGEETESVRRRRFSSPGVEGLGVGPGSEVKEPPSSTEEEEAAGEGGGGGLRGDTVCLVVVVDSRCLRFGDWREGFTESTLAERCSSNNKLKAVPIGTVLNSRTTTSQKCETLRLIDFCITQV